MFFHIDMNLKAYIREVPDFPKLGINFYDITTLLQNNEVFHYIIDQFKIRYQDKKINVIAGIESRGFIFGTALAYALNVSFVPIRKVGKLPYKTYSESYTLEYSKNIIECHQDAFSKGDKILLMDDLIATGGSAEAAIKLIHKFNDVELVEVSFLLELTFFNGRKKLSDYNVYSMLKY